MSLFLTDAEREQAINARKSAPFNSFFWTLSNRVERRVASPGLTDRYATCEWWHFTSEYLTDAAMLYRTHYKPSESLIAWIRDVSLSIARRPVDDWVGPDFRDHTTKPPKGHLETAHLSWSLAIALDLAGDVFTPAERDEIAATLREKAMPLCLQYLNQVSHISNWHCILMAGLAVPAAVLNDKENLQRARQEFELCCDFFQPDGSYGESLQYGNYALYGIMLTREALVRHNPALDAVLTVEPYVKKVYWDIQSLFYKKPLTGWGPYPLARSANFNDSAAVYRASADILLHIAVRAKDRFPQEAGLARWLFETLYMPCIEIPPNDKASFGFKNDFGFLTLALWSNAPAVITPEQAKIPLTAGFSCGDVFTRDAWNGRTILAARAGGDPLHSLAHHHGDVNSFILVHNEERLLLDGGHCCYRNLSHDVEVSSLTHNTCTFVTGVDKTLSLHDQQLIHRTIQQAASAHRSLDKATRKAGAPVDRGDRRLLLARQNDVTAIASDAAALYGAPIDSFKRFWLQCGSHVLFVVDHIVSSEPVTTSWSWLLNNRDGLLDLKVVRPDRLVARRGNAGMKLFHMGGGNLGGPLYGYVHDAYHPLPNQLGEGKPGSGLLMRFTEKAATTERLVAHAITVDDYGNVAGWHLKSEPGYVAVLESPGATQVWKLKMSNSPLSITAEDAINKRHYSINLANGKWELTAS